jgi:hypothetical protein
MTLKIDHTPQTVNASSKSAVSPQLGAPRQLLCCFDISKASLSLYAEYQPVSGSRASRIEQEIPNQTGAIERLLARLQGLAEETGLQDLLVLAEATGGYEKKLLQTAQEIYDFQPRPPDGPDQSRTRLEAKNR